MPNNYTELGNIMKHLRHILLKSSLYDQLSIIKKLKLLIVTNNTNPPKSSLKAIALYEFSCPLSFILKLVYYY